MVQLTKKVIIGMGGSISAKDGARIDAIFPKMLHIPKAVPAKITGKI